MFKYSLITAGIMLLASIALSVFSEVPDRPVVYMSYAKPSDAQSEDNEIIFMIRNHRRPTKPAEIALVYGKNRSSATYPVVTSEKVACMANIKNTFFVYAKAQPYGPDVMDYEPIKCGF